MNKIITYPFGEDFIGKLAGFLEDNYLKAGQGMDRLAIVFGGRRPALFLKRELGQRAGRAFASPRFFTIDEWMAYVVRKNETFAPVEDLNHCYLLYNLARQLTPEVLNNRESFAEFLPWSREILKFIDQLDLENVENDNLTRVRENAQIGYPVPDDI